MEQTRQNSLKRILSANSRHIKRWVELLCSTEEYFKAFIENYLDIADLEYSLFEFRDYLKNTGRGRDVTTAQIRQCIIKKDTKKLKFYLEEVLLVPVCKAELAKVLKLGDDGEIEGFIKNSLSYANIRHTKVIEEYFSYTSAS